MKIELKFFDSLEYKPLSYLDKMCQFLFDEFKIISSIPIVSCILYELGWSQKKVYIKKDINIINNKK